MARIKLLGQDDVPENARPYLQEQQDTYGTVLNSTAFAAYFPGMMAASRELGNAIDKGELSAEFRRLLNVKVASQIGCPFWVDTNASGASKEGASDDRILALLDFRGSDLFSDAEKVALELSEAMTDTPQRVTDELFRELQQHYTNPQIVELASIIALENFRSRFNRCGAVEPHGFYPMLGELLSAAGMPTDAVPQPA